MWLGNEGYGRLQSMSSDRTLRKTCSVPSPYLLRTNSEKRRFQESGKKGEGSHELYPIARGVQQTEFIDILINPFKKKGKVMGKIRQGILGGFNGTVGTVVGGSWKGTAYMRGKAQSIKNPRTEKQMAQRIKFGIAQKFLKVMTGYLQTGYRNYTQHQTATNAAMSHTVRNCIVGKYPTFGIDPSKVQVSSGSLMPGRFCTVKVANNVATFAWEDNSDESHASVDDFAMPLIYNFTKREAIFTTEEASRVDCKVTLKLPADWDGDMLSCYIGFASVQNNGVSNSVYVGDVKSDGSVEPGANGILYNDGVIDNTPGQDNTSQGTGSEGEDTKDDTKGDNKGEDSSGDVGL